MASFRSLLAIPCVLVILAAAEAQDSAPIRRPDRFGIIFNLGYGGDHMPADLADFEKLVVAVKKMNFNVIMGKYDEKRLEICQKHDIQLFVDLLVGEHHVYKNTDEAKRVCEAAKNSKAIYGYHLWSDVIGKTYDGRSRDAKNVREWDPNHPVYVGTYRMSGIGRVKDMDMFGYYDFHWTRGGHWGHLAQAWNLAKDRKIPFLRYDAAAPGMVGKGNPNRVGYTFATSIPFGLRGYTFHYAGGQLDRKTFELDALGQDLAVVNGRFAQVGAELMKIAISPAVYSTPITKTEKNDPIATGPVIPGNLAPIPKDSWFQIKTGEVLVGVSTDDAKRDVLIFANHNPYESQKVALAFAGDVKEVEVFDRATRQWRQIPVDNREARLTVEDYGVELLRVRR